MDNLIREQYISWCRDVKGLSEKTIIATTESFEAFFDRYGGELTLESVEGFIVWMRKAGMSAQTMVNRGGHIKRLVKYASRKELCEDFTQDIQLPKLHYKPPVALTLEDVERAIMAGTEILGSENKKIKYNKVESRDALKFCLRTGLRRSELLALKPEHIKLDEKAFFVVTTKSYKTVLMPLPLDMVEEIKNRMEREYLFMPTDAGVLNDCLHRGSKKAGLSKRLSPHDLRRAFIMDLFRRGVSIQTIKDLARHADYSSLAKYSSAMLSEKSHALNSSSLTSKSLGHEDILEIVKTKIQETGILKNKNVKAEIAEKGREFVFRVAY